MGKLWRIPASGEHINLGPSVAPSAVQLRLPVVEQLATQLGGAFAHGARPLLPRELEVARPVFGPSIKYEAVRVAMGYVANAPTTLGSYIRVSSAAKFDDSTLVHELTHVWQYQTQGTGYISNSMCAQIAGALGQGSRNAAYEIRPSQVHAVQSFHDLSAEHQARVVEFYFVSRLLRDPNPKLRERARREFWYLVQDLTDPSTDRAKSDAEVADLERMIADVRRARPISAIAIYEESLHGPGASHGLLDGLHGSERHIMPFLRIDF